MVISSWLLHRHRELWDRPDEFDPDRFDGGLDQASCAYIPFGQGPRICIGAAFAMQEAMLILASLTRRYRFEPDPRGDPEPTSRLTIRSKDGIFLKIFKRPPTREPTPPEPTPPTQEEKPSAESAPRCPFSH
jgi:cytochrome P450